MAELLLVACTNYLALAFLMGVWAICTAVVINVWNRTKPTVTVNQYYQGCLSELGPEPKNEGEPELY